MSSILTNNSAMSALATLRGINDNLNNTQSRISSGMKVQSGKDNASYFSISKTMNSESGMNKAISEGLTLTKNSVSTARLGAETMVDLAQQFVDRVAFATSSGIDRGKVQEELDSLAAQMLTAIEQSAFNGENLIDAAGAGTHTAISGVSRSGSTLATTDITFTTTDMSALQSALAAIDISTASDGAMSGHLSTADTALASIIDAATELGVAEKAIETQQNFLQDLTDKLDSGVGSMVDANMEEEAARLQSLQVQQQLATQSLSIANQAPQNILSLFR